MSSLCDYVYYPAGEVCQPYYDSVQGLVYSYGTVRNYNLYSDVLLECSMGTIYYNHGFYTPDHLENIAVFSRKPYTGTETISISLHAATMGDNSWDEQSSCSNATSTTSPRQTTCTTEPLDSGQVLAAFHIQLPNLADYGDYYIQGFRLCYNPS